MVGYVLFYSESTEGIRVCGDESRVPYALGGPIPRHTRRNQVIPSGNIPVVPYGRHHCSELCEVAILVVVAGTMLMSMLK